MVHVIFDPNSVSLSDFEDQIGYGEYNVFHGDRPFQRGYGYYQHGTGITDFFRSLWRTMLPFVKTAGKVVGQEALSTGSRILEKVAHGENLKETVNNEALKGVENLIQKAGNQKGGAIKRRKKSKLIHSSKNLIGKRVKFSSSPSPVKIRKRSDAFGFY